MLGVASLYVSICMGMHVKGGKRVRVQAWVINTVVAHALSLSPCPFMQQVRGQVPESANRTGAERDRC